VARKFEVSGSCIQDRRKRKIFFYKAAVTGGLFSSKVKFSEIEEKLSSYLTL
jgi:hypothetical protein